VQGIRDAEQLSNTQSQTGQSSIVNHNLADASAPTKDFREYPANTTLSGRRVLPDFSGRDSEYRDFRTRILNGMNSGPNFGGTFTIIEIGCGTSCRSAIIADHNTGRLWGFPLGGEENHAMQLQYSVLSRLINAYWIDSKREKCVLQQFVWDGAKFSNIHSQDFGPSERCYSDLSSGLDRSLGTGTEYSPPATEADIHDWKDRAVSTQSDLPISSGMSYRDAFKALSGSNWVRTPQNMDRTMLAQQLLSEFVEVENCTEGPMPECSFFLSRDGRRLRVFTFANQELTVRSWQLDAQPAPTRPSWAQ
jgi:hypothetical protein